MEKLTPVDLREIFVDLQTAGLEAVVVGGQAVNLWAYQYYEASPKLKELLPLASEDLDFYGGRVEATLVGEVLGGWVEGRGSYAFFGGRLSPEKGLDTLLAAWKRLEGQVPLKIGGDDPLASQVAEAVKKLDYVEWLRRRPMEEVYALMGEAMFLIFPSNWYETFGRVAVEAFAKGTPVIAANIGAIAELIDHNRTGLHFCPGDSEDLAAKVEWALAHPRKLA